MLSGEKMLSQPPQRASEVDVDVPRTSQPLPCCLIPLSSYKLSAEPKDKKKKKLVCTKLPQKTDLKNQCPDVIIKLGSYYHFLLILCILYLTVFFFVVVVVVMYKSPQIWFSSKQDINSK